MTKWLFTPRWNFFDVNVLLVSMMLSGAGFWIAALILIVVCAMLSVWMERRL